MKHGLSLAVLLTLAVVPGNLHAQTGATSLPDRIAAPFPTPQTGLGAVMGKDIATLKRLFGEPRLDVVEVYGRKLQFSGKACVLDAYLYPDGPGGTEIVTYVDARRTDGAAVDKASCVGALIRR